MRDWEALLRGDLHYERPQREGGARWGLSAILRPRLPLKELSDSLGRALGPGHWLHGEESLHFTLRTLEPVRSRIPADDPLLAVYGEALDQAMRGLPPIRVELRGVVPHPGAVIVKGIPLDDTLVTLQRRFAERLRRSGADAFEHWERDGWHLSLVHFATPLRDPGAVAEWCEQRRDLKVGVAELDTAEIVSWRPDAQGMRATVLRACGPEQPAYGPVQPAYGPGQPAYGPGQQDNPPDQHPTPAHPSA